MTPTPSLRITHVLCPTDFSAGARPAFDHAVALAERFEARLTLLHVWKLPDNIRPDLSVSLSGDGARRGESYADYSERIAREKAGQLTAILPPAVKLRTAVDVLSGDPAQVILDHARAKGCDMIVMGTHGFTKIAHFVLGSVAEKVVRQAPCPVLTVRMRRE
jgi:universal stress protein A